MEYRQMAGRMAVWMAALSLAVMPVSAQITEQDCTRRGTAVVFDGATDQKESIVTYTVRGNGNDAALYFIGEATADTEGKFSVSFSLEASGEYVLKLKDTAGDTLDKPIAYLNEADNGALLTVEVNSGEDARIKAALTELDFRVLDKAWSALKTDKLEAWVVDCVKKKIPYADNVVLQADCAAFTALYQINSAKAADIAAVCGKYAALLGLAQNADMSAFIAGATDAQKRALVQSVSSAPATSADMLARAVSAALKAGGDSGGKGSGSGSSKGSGGGGGGFVGVQAPLPNQTETPDEAQTPGGDSFSDLHEAEWARGAIEILAARGVVSGDGDGRFRPNDTVTREEFVKMLTEASGIASEDAACPFVDVFRSDWFCPYVGAAKKAGIVTGLSGDIFGVGLNISRQDAAVMIHRAAAYKGKNLEAQKAYASFSDQEQIAAYAADAVKALYECGVISGMEDGSFRPLGICTRAEAAKLICGLL